jgi:Zn-dependent peptidase ImmA (M78 family)
MSDWFQQQFGRKDEFALVVWLGRDPHPGADDVVSASWGGLAVWVDGRCLTQTVRDDGSTAEQVRWYMLPVLGWLREHLVRLVNEEPFPSPARTDEVGDASAWFDASMEPGLTLLPEEETDWYTRRSQWRAGHGLRQAALDAALPNVCVRRLGRHLEVSWDNEAWPASRPDLRFVEPRGRALVDAAAATDVLRDTLHVLSERLQSHAQANDPAQARAMHTALGSGACDLTDDDWQWLVPEETRRLIFANDSHFAAGNLLAELRSHTRESRCDALVPHTRRTLALRQLRASVCSDVDAVLAALERRPANPARDEFLKLRRPRPAIEEKPWLVGYDAALEVRDQLGWGADPCPSLTSWFVQQGVPVARDTLPSQVDVVACWYDEQHASASINVASPRYRRIEMGEATVLGHLLLDTEQVTIDGASEHWPAAARARAFAAMLMLPEEGLRGLVRGVTVDAARVRNIADHFGVGVHATAWHLRNLGLLDDDARVEILATLRRAESDKPGNHT